MARGKQEGVSVVGLVGLVGHFPTLRENIAVCKFTPTGWKPTNQTN